MAKKKKVDEEVYEVEVITKARVGDEGQWEYLVKWDGYDSDADSWEPADNVQQCDRLLTSFWKHVGIDDNDYAVGYEVAAHDDWIDREKQYFARNLKPSKSKGYKESRRKEYQGKGKSTMTQKAESEDESDNSSDIPLVKETTRKKHNTLAGVSSHAMANSGGQLQSAPPQQISKDTSAAPIEQASTLGAFPKPVFPRTHHDQKTNPLVKSINLPPHTVEAGSSLTTKQRIAAGLPLAPSVTKSISNSTKSFSSLSFKKNKPSLPVAVQAKDSMESSAPAISPHSPSTMESSSFPMDMDVDQNTGPFGSSSADIDFVGQSPEFHMAASKPSEHIQAERFLQDIDIPLLHTPLEPDLNVMSPMGMDVSGPIKPSAVPKISKKWKWSGDLFISSEHKTELLCHITIKDLSESSNSSHISILLSSSVDSLWISKLYSVSELSPVFRAYGKAQYFGKLESTEVKDEVLVQGLENHMSYHKQAAAISLVLDQTEIAILVIFPATLSGLVQFLEVPDHHLSDTSLLVVLLPLVVSWDKSSGCTGWRSMDIIHNITKSSLTLKKPLLSQAISFLGFPKSLLEFLDSGGSSKSYCIWFSDADLGHSCPGFETMLLQVILQSTKANLAKLEEDVRVVFIHIGAFASISSMSGLVAKRANFPETQFFTYGSYPNVEIERWGLHEIFPLGGIVTFTATAIAEDPLGCYHLMLQISEHPFWECYIVSEVLGACYLLENSEGKVATPLFLDPILDLVDSGQLCMGNLGNESPLWLSQLLRNSSLTRHELLEECSRSLKAHSSSTTVAQLVTLANEALTKDLAKVQWQPVVMDNYRRFVVIKAMSEAMHAEKDGFEWCPLVSFEFKDDFF